MPLHCWEKSQSPLSSFHPSRSSVLWHAATSRPRRSLKPCAESLAQTQQMSVMSPRPSEWRRVNPAVSRGISHTGDDRGWNRRHREQLSGQKYSSKTAGWKGNPVAFLWLLYAAHCAAEAGSGEEEEGGEEGSVREMIKWHREEAEGKSSHSSEAKNGRGESKKNQEIRKWRDVKRLRLWLFVSETLLLG